MNRSKNEEGWTDADEDCGLMLAAYFNTLWKTTKFMFLYLAKPRKQFPIWSRNLYST